MRVGFVLLAFLFFLSFSHSIKFELIPNTEKCIKEGFQQDTLVKGSVEVSPIFGDMQVYMRVGFFLYFLHPKKSQINPSIFLNLQEINRI